MPADDARLTPSHRHLVLEQLSRDRLLELSAHFELGVTDRQATDGHIDAT